MNRREVVAGLVGAAAWPASAARAQHAAMPVIGFLNAGAPDGYAPMAAAFRQGLKEAGYNEAQNVTIEYRWADGHYDRLPAMAADLVRRQVAVIFTNSPGLVATKAMTTTIPIVFATAGDPVELGFVAALNRPGGNITGVTQLSVEVASKRLQLMHELVPMATTIAVLLNPTYPSAETQLRDMRAAARTLGLQVPVLRASNDREINDAFATLVQLRAGAFVISSDPFLNSRTKQLAALALRHAVPTIFQYREFAAGGGLMSYGGSIIESYRLAGLYTGRILKGEKPADLPVQQATKIELIINLKTAKALGLTIPETLLATADELIQ
jgi:putative tryptophan/tyrosine transport system substrate-binding protein